MSRPQRVHTFQRADLEMSDLLGVEARALCGRWVSVEACDRIGGGERIGTAESTGDGCMRCAASVRRIIRDKAARHG